MSSISDSHLSLHTFSFLTLDFTVTLLSKDASSTVVFLLYVLNLALRQ